jgi:hypothetical protein
VDEQAESCSPDPTVTGDARVLRVGVYRGVQVVTARAFLDILGALAP